MSAVKDNKVKQLFDIVLPTSAEIKLDRVEFVVSTRLGEEALIIVGCSDKCLLQYSSKDKYRFFRVK